MYLVPQLIVQLLLQPPLLKKLCDHEKDSSHNIVDTQNLVHYKIKEILPKHVLLEKLFVERAVLKFVDYEKLLLVFLVQEPAQEFSFLMKVLPFYLLSSLLNEFQHLFYSQMSIQLHAAKHRLIVVSNIPNLPFVMRYLQPPCGHHSKI